MTIERMNGIIPIFSSWLFLCVLPVLCGEREVF